VTDKDIPVFKRLVDEFKIVKSQGWMVGNSPNADINPALQAGLNAIFIPHASTWAIDKDEVECGAGRLLIVTAFRELRSHF
jgi:putative hydrolase of the HAD superfamily